MKWFKSENRIILNVVIALVVGIVFGNFLKSTILTNETIMANADNRSDEVYIFESGVYYDEVTATIALNDLEALEIDGLVVKENNKYHVYHQISYEKNDLNGLIRLFNEKELDYFIKTKKLYALVKHLDQNSTVYQFYTDTIKYYLQLLHNQNVVISQDYKDQITLETTNILDNMNVLNNNLNTELTPMYKLYVYQSIVDSL